MNQSLEMKALSESDIARLIQLTCVLEACAPKPGNVNRFHDFRDASLEDFLLSASALAAACQNMQGKGVGQVILEAAVNTRNCARSNTNLGMLLLLVPLAKVLSQTGTVNMRDNLHFLLSNLTVEDARLTYAAIRLLQPGGMGRVPHADISQEPSVSLLEAMAMAQDRDAIASEYLSDYAITFETGLPAFREAFSHGANYFESIVHTFLKIMEKIPDTLIARKSGWITSDEVSRMAADVLASGGVFTEDGHARLAKMDAMLRNPNHPLNPGTTADLTAAATFLFLVERAQGRCPFPSARQTQNQNDSC